MWSDWAILKSSRWSFYNKSSPNAKWLLGNFENITSQIKTKMETFWATFGIIWATFCFIIWSHNTQAFAKSEHDSCNFNAIVLALLASVKTFSHPNFCRVIVRKQHDQIGRFNALWATFQNLWQQLFCPNCLHCYIIPVKASKTLIFLVEKLLGNFYRHLATFYLSHCQRK